MDVNATEFKEAYPKSVKSAKKGGKAARGKGRGKKKAHGFGKTQSAVHPEAPPAIFSFDEEMEMQKLSQEAMQESKRRTTTINRTVGWMTSCAGEQEAKVLTLFKGSLVQLCANPGPLEDPHLQQHRMRVTLECLREVGALCLPLGCYAESLSLIEAVKKAAGSKQADIKRLATEVLDRWRSNLKEVCVNLVDTSLSEDPFLAVSIAIRDKEIERRGAGKLN